MQHLAKNDLMPLVFPASTAIVLNLLVLSRRSSYVGSPLLFFIAYARVYADGRHQQRYRLYIEQSATRIVLETSTGPESYHT